VSTSKKTTGRKTGGTRKKTPVYVSDLMKQPPSKTSSASSSRPAPSTAAASASEDVYGFVSQGYRSISRNLVQLIPNLRKDPVGTIQDLQIRAIAFVTRALPGRKANVDGKPDYRHLRREWIKRRALGVGRHLKAKLGRKN